jgi:hypothetical protein
MCGQGIRPWSAFRGKKYLGTIYAGKALGAESVKMMAPEQGYFGVDRVELVLPRGEHPGGRVAVANSPRRGSSGSDVHAAPATIAAVDMDAIEAMFR